MHPVLFRIGPLTVYFYGVMVTVAFLVAALLMRSRACNFGIRPAVVLDFITWIFISGIAGARLTYILINLDIFIADPLEMIMLHHGGLVFFGGLLGGFLGSILFVRKRGLSFPEIADLTAPYIAPAAAIQFALMTAALSFPVRRTSRIARSYFDVSAPMFIKTSAGIKTSMAPIQKREGKVMISYVAGREGLPGISPRFFFPRLPVPVFFWLSQCNIPP